LADEFVHKTLDLCDGNLLLRQGQPVFIEHRGALFRRRVAAECRTSVYCLSCRGPMTSLMGREPYQCRNCGVKLDFSALQLETVLSELP
jgi:hypothetical protein